MFSKHENSHFGFVNCNLPIKNTSLGDSLGDFIYNFPGTAHLKDIKEFKYILSNKHDLKTYDFHLEKDLIGQNVFDLEQKMRSKWPVNFAKQIYKNDMEVVKTEKPVTINNIIILTGEGFVSVRTLMKTPIFNFQGNVTNILTLGLDSTKSVGVPLLWSLYKKFYDTRNEAAIKFSEYIGLKDFMTVPPTIRELDCFVALIQYQTMKRVGYILHISSRTVERHIDNIKSKLRDGNLQRVMEKIIQADDGFLHESFNL